MMILMEWIGIRRSNRPVIPSLASVFSTDVMYVKAAKAMQMVATAATAAAILPQILPEHLVQVKLDPFQYFSVQTAQSTT